MFAMYYYFSNVVNLRLWAGLWVRGNYTLTNAQQISINQITVVSEHCLIGT